MGPFLETKNRANLDHEVAIFLPSNWDTFWSKSVSKFGSKSVSKFGPFYVSKNGAITSPKMGATEWGRVGICMSPALEFHSNCGAKIEHKQKNTTFRAVCPLVNFCIAYAGAQDGKTPKAQFGPTSKNWFFRCCLKSSQLASKIQWVNI